MIAMVFIIPVSYRIGRFRDSIAYLSAYMSTFLEPDLEFTWERDHCRYRKENAVSKSFLYIISRCDFIILSLASAASFWKLNGFNMIHNSLFWTLITAGVQIIMLMLVIISTARYSNVDDLKESKLKKWSQIHSDNHNGNDNSTQQLNHNVYCGCIRVGITQDLNVQTPGDCDIKVSKDGEILVNQNKP